jgi:hypothetical protein
MRGRAGPALNRAKSLTDGDSYAVKSNRIKHVPPKTDFHFVFDFMFGF